jgi:hypothetical protein
MVRRPKPILEVLYEPRDGPRGAGGVAHQLGHVEQYCRLKFQIQVTLLDQTTCSRPMDQHSQSQPDRFESWTHLGYLLPVTD